MNSVYLLLFICGCAVTGQDIGTPYGYMADCPGMKANTTFSKKTLKSFYAAVLWPGIGWFKKSETTCSLDDAGADCVAKHVDLKHKDVVIFVSGYLDASFSPITRTMAGPYLQHGRIVIIMELFPILLQTYPVAARLTKPLGVLLGKFLVKLSNRGLDSKRIQMLGASLGAHISSFAATKYHEITGTKISRLTGLDPAGPCFRNLPPRDRFNAHAAEKVDALHTNMDGFGIADALAHIDYYANGGEYQPKLGAGYLLPCLHLCSHFRAAFYWMTAYNYPDKFLAVRCNSLSDVRRGNCYDHDIVSNVLGPHANFSRPGIYYLPTLETSPYYMGRKGLNKNKYGSNNYLLKVAKEEEITI